MPDGPGFDAHQFNNPLAALVTNLELASRDIDEAIAVHGDTALLVALREEIRDARRGAERLHQVVRELAGDRSDPPTATSAVPVASRRGRVLVVDDEPLMGRLVQRTLGTEHEVVVTLQATEALARIGAGDRFDLILCDVMMPEMTGVELHAELMRWVPDQAGSMVFLTGGGFTTSLRATLDALGCARIEKPFDIPALRAFVNGRIATRPRRPGG